MRDWVIDTWGRSRFRLAVIWPVRQVESRVPYLVSRTVRLSLTHILYGGPALLILLGLLAFKLVSGGRRVIFIPVNVSRIGHLASETEMALRLTKNSDRRDYYIGLAFMFTACNRQLLTMYRRQLPIIESVLLEKIILTTFLKRTEFVYNRPLNDKNYDEFNNYSPVLSFTAAEEARGRRELAALGIGENDWFVCFHARDRAYLGPDSSHHDHRDADIENYLAAAEDIVKRGGFAIRMGAKVGKPLPKERHPRIIDYALERRSDFLDIYLPAHCKYFLGSTAGLFLVAQIFSVPVAAANFVPLDITPLRRGDLYISKKLWSLAENRLLSFREIFGSPAAHYTLPAQYQAAGLRLIENSPEEILDLAREMEAALAGQPPAESDERLRAAHRALFRPQHLCFGSPAQFAASFLRRHSDLLA